jgi:hypothetical protein
MDDFFHFDFDFEDWDDEDDDFGIEIIEVPKAPPGAGALARHPLLEGLVAEIDRLIRRSGELLGDEQAFDDVLQADLTEPTCRPVDDPVLRALGAARHTRHQAEQLNLFTAEELGEFSVATVPSNSERAVLGALLLDWYDPREGHLASAEFNRSIRPGEDAAALAERTVDLAQIVFAGAITAGTNLLAFFRRMSMIAEAESR